MSAGDGLDILAAFVQANVDGLAWTNEQIRLADERRIETLSSALLMLWDGLDAMPDYVRTAYIERLMFDPRVSLQVEAARRRQEQS